MPTHNCETCGSKGVCPLETIAPWLNEHEEESNQATHNSAGELAKAACLLVYEAPSLLASKEVVISAVDSAFLLGYSKGRTYQSIPDAFKNM